MFQNISNLYFSPTGSSKEIGKIICQEISDKLGLKYTEINFTQPKGWEKPINPGNDDIILMAFPVYSGRMPKVFAEAIQNRLQGSGFSVIPVAVYGNRAFDDALLEARDLLIKHDCDVIAAIAAIAQHTFDSAIGSGRPDQSDKTKLTEFAAKIAEKIKTDSKVKPQIPGQYPFVEPKPLPPLVPVTSDACNYCGICAKLCPMGIIDPADEHKIGSGCILCSACVKYCPQQAKSLPAEFLSAVRAMLAKVAAERREPELFI